MSREITKVAIVAHLDAHVQHSCFTHGACPTKTSQYFSTQSSPIAHRGWFFSGGSGRKSRHRSSLLADDRRWRLRLLSRGLDSITKSFERQLGCVAQEC